MARRGTIIALLLLSTVLLLCRPALADFRCTRGLYHARSYGGALREFPVLAQQGNREARACLGRMHRAGTGVQRQYTTAFSVIA